MPMISDAEDQHDAPEDVKDWENAEVALRQLTHELRDYIDLVDARGTTDVPAAQDTGGTTKSASANTWLIRIDDELH